MSKKKERRGEGEGVNLLSFFVRKQVDVCSLQRNGPSRLPILLEKSKKNKEGKQCDLVVSMEVKAARVEGGKKGDEHLCLFGSRSTSHLERQSTVASRFPVSFPSLTKSLLSDLLVPDEQKQNENNHVAQNDEKSLTRS